MGDELFRGQFRAVEIASGQTCSANVELAHATRRHRLKLRIQDVQLSVSDGMADGYRPLPEDNLAAGGKDGGLGWAIEVPEGSSPSHQACRELSRQGFPPAQDLQGGVPVPPSVQQQAPGRWGCWGEGCVRAGQALDQPGSINRRLAADEHHASTHRQRQEDFQDGQVKGQGRDGEEGILIGQPGLPTHGPQAIDYRVVRDLDTLGLAGGSGGIDHIGQVLVGHCCGRVGFDILPPDLTA